jgi:hypothetical protein
MMWNQFGWGLQPPSPHFTMISRQGVTQNSRWTSKSLVSKSSCNVVRTHPYAHPLHMKVVKHLACVCQWCEINLDWVYSLHHYISPRFLAKELPRILGGLPKAWSAKAHIHMHIHCIWRLSNTLHVFDNDVKSIWIGSTASITTLHHDLYSQGVTQNSRWLPKAWSAKAAVMW